jgi:ABC-type lipoprotein export system ATPase subunit
LRLMYLALYEICLAQLRTANSDESNLTALFRIIPLWVARQLGDTFLHKYDEYNKKVVCDISDTHVAVLKKLDHLQKSAECGAIDDSECNVLIQTHHILLLKNHICKTRCMSFALKVCANAIDICTATRNPFYGMCICLFIRSVETGMADIYLASYDEINRDIRQASDQHSKVIRNFINNKRIIYECSGEDAFLETIVRSVDGVYELVRNYERACQLNFVNFHTECDYEQKRWLLSLIVPESDGTNASYRELKLAMSRLGMALAEYDDLQAKLSLLPLAKLDAIAPSPEKNIHVEIGRIAKRRLFTIKPGVYRISDQLLFTVRRPLVIPSLSWVTVLGASGSGKTTLCQLCIKLVPDTMPRRITFIDTYDDYDYAAIRPYISVISPDADLFDDSIQYNLTYGTTLPLRTALKRIRKYMVRFGMGHLLGKLGENARSLSTGERQRIKLIRCILHDKPIWIFDEMTAHIDEQFENRILHLLKRLQIKRNKSIIHITHNRTLTKWSDYILTIRNKQVSIHPVKRCSSGGFLLPN